MSFLRPQTPASPGPVQESPATLGALQAVTCPSYLNPHCQLMYSNKQVGDRAGRLRMTLTYSKGGGARSETLRLTCAPVLTPALPPTGTWSHATRCELDYIRGLVAGEPLPAHPRQGRLWREATCRLSPPPSEGSPSGLSGLVCREALSVGRLTLRAEAGPRQHRVRKGPRGHAHTPLSTWSSEQAGSPCLRDSGLILSSRTSSPSRAMYSL